MVLTVFAGIAEFERDLIHERTNSGRISTKGAGCPIWTAAEADERSDCIGATAVGQGTSVPEASRILKVHKITLTEFWRHEDRCRSPAFSRWPQVTRLLGLG